MYRLIPPFVVLTPHDSNVAVHAQREAGRTPYLIFLGVPFGIMANERLLISFTFLRFLLLQLLSVFCGTIDEACSLGKTLTPSLGLKFAPGSPEKYLWKSTGLKCSEHIAEFFVVFQCARFALIKSTHFLRLLGASAQSSPKNGIIWRAIPFFKVRNVVATKGNTSSRHFTTPHISYFTENTPL